MIYFAENNVEKSVKFYTMKCTYVLQKHKYLWFIGSLALSHAVHFGSTLRSSRRTQTSLKFGRVSWRQCTNAGHCSVNFGVGHSDREKIGDRRREVKRRDTIDHRQAYTTASSSSPPNFRAGLWYQTFIESATKIPIRLQYSSQPRTTTSVKCKPWFITTVHVWRTQAIDSATVSLIIMDIDLPMPLVGRKPLATAFLWSSVLALSNYVCIVCKWQNSFRQKLDGLPSTVMPPAAVTMIFRHLTPKANQHTYEPICICDPDWVKFPSLVSEIWCSQCFRDAQTHSLTHSQTDRAEYSIPPAPFFNGGEGIKRSNVKIR